MEKVAVLESLNLGNSVAEYDKNIAEYFIDTSYVQDFVNDKYDIVKGVKGAGKTAMLISMCDNQPKYDSIADVNLIQAINLKGDPDFKRAFNGIENIEHKLDEQKMIDAWKLYIINIVWKNITDTFSGYEKLEEYLKQHKLITENEGFLAKILYSLKRARIKITNTFNTDGSTTQGIELVENDNYANEDKEQIIINFNYIFEEIDKILLNNSCRMWVMMDRLDDAFPDNTEKSILALKSLLYAYKDICINDNIKVKIFIRDDIFNNVTVQGFTSLTHVASKTMAPIKWDRAKLEQLLIERLLFNNCFKEYLAKKNISIDQRDRETLDKIFELSLKKQVDTGKNNPDTIGWIINHIKDGLNIFTPRDFIDMIDTARQYQLQELKDGVTKNTDDYLIGATSLRKAYTQISKQKLETQLYAEYPQLRKWIEKFKNSKAEHNEESLKKTLGKQWKSKTEKLVNIGFIEDKQSTWKIPFLYREGLNISQGKAF